jgi:hypothetical protein
MNIKIFNNFIDDRSADLIINYIDNNLNKFVSYQDDKYRILLFGKDKYHKESIEYLEGIDEIKDLIIEYFNKVINKVKNEFNYNDELYINSFWLAKQSDGSHLDMHNDSDNGNNTQFKYSCAIYLNDTIKDGELYFPYFNYKYKSIKGDLVCWPSTEPEYDHCIKKISSTRYAVLFWLTNDKDYALNY